MNLTGANLEGANLEGANLEGANLEGADFRWAYIDRSIWLQKDIDKYINFIKQSKFDEIYIYSEKTGEETRLTRDELLAQYPD